MEGVAPNSTSLFDVYLRLRPPTAHATERFLEVDNGSATGHKSHVTLVPLANDNRKRAVEKFAFTRVFEEDAAQLEVFKGTGVVPLIEGVLGQEGKAGRDGLLATLGVTGSGKSHTILGSRCQRGLTQLTLDVLFRSLGNSIARSADAVGQLAAVDVSEAQILPATNFLQSIYGEGDSRMHSRAQTPMTVSTHNPGLSPSKTPQPGILRSLLGLGFSAAAKRDREHDALQVSTIRPVTGFAHVTRSVTKIGHVPTPKDTNWAPIYAPTSSRRVAPRASNLPQAPSVEDVQLAADHATEYAVVVSMYEVYNDRIFDLLTGAALASKTPLKDLRRRPLLFKSTEYSPDRKVVAGLKKIVCETLEEALLVLETGLTERRVAGTGSNAVSSRSHGFICVEVKKRGRSRQSSWSSSTLTIVDLAGSERARTAKTAGATLAEAGKINESLMYLGQCMQMQADNSINSGTTAPDKLVPFRQCKLTELLFSNSFAYHNNQHNQSNSNFYSRPQQHHQQQPQKSIMIVTADPRGDFNATSQILRYSALAREVTVPRIPSVSSTILAGCPLATPSSSRPNTANGDDANHSFTRLATDAEITRLQEDVAVLRLQLAEETRRRREAEASWATAEERLEGMEAEIRDECWSSFEQRLELERERWSAAWAEERERVEGHLDRKVELLVRGLDDGTGACDGVGAGTSVSEREVETWKDRMELLERENEVLKERVEGFERQQQNVRTPSRKMKVLKARKWTVDCDEDGDAEFDQENICPL